MYLHSAPLADIAGKLRSGTVSLKDYINNTCDMIEEVDHKLEAFLPETGRRDRLLLEAENLLAAYPEPSQRPPLFGVLIGVKDIYHADGFETRAGSRLDPGVLSGSEADTVRLLKQAGAIVLGKTVTTEFAYFESGPTRNPHNLNHTPGGSSSGSAAAVAAGMTPLALGTQTIGSINRPAAFCGVVGFKPSYGRIPTGGLLYFSRSADHAGCFTQDVEGMLLAASVLCHDWREIKVNYLPVLGIPRGKYLDQATDEALNAFETQVARLQAEGYKVQEVNTLDDIGDIALWHRKLVSAELAIEHAELYSRFSELYRPKTAELIEEGLLVDKKDLAEARKRQKNLRDRLETEMRQAGIDLWITPAAPGPAPAGIEATGDPAMNLPWTNTGLPSVNIPAGKAQNGLPLGLQLIAPYMGDELLLSWAKGVANVFPDYQSYRV